MLSREGAASRHAQRHELLSRYPGRFRRDRRLSAAVAGYRDSPPRIIVRAHGLRRSGESVVLVEFTTTEGNEIAAASTSVMERLGLERKVQRAILRVPQTRSQDLLSDDAR
jgi:hypothetical protein